MTHPTTYPTYMTSKDLKWKGVVKSISKSGKELQPIYEAITNALESLEMRRRQDKDFSPYIRIVLRYGKNLLNERGELREFTVEDNGVGFDDENFSRLLIFKDDSKGFNNLGSGRIQFVHFFHTTEYESVFIDADKNLSFRKITLSKDDKFLENNAIVRLDSEVSNGEYTDIFTRVTLKGFLFKRDKTYYDHLSIDTLKEDIINHYVLYFCSHAEFPKFEIEYYLDDELIDKRIIQKGDTPMPSEQSFTIELPLSSIEDDCKRITQLGDTTEIEVRAYKLSHETLKKNQIKIACKEEIVEGVDLRLSCLKADEVIDNNRFLFLLTGKYFDELAQDDRADIKILNKREFRKSAVKGLVNGPQLLSETIEDLVSEKAESIFSEIGAQKEKYVERLKRLKEQYLITDEALAEAKVDDSVEDILQKAYSYDAKIIAKSDAAYQKCLDKLKLIDTSSEDYPQELNNIVGELSECIPMKDRNTLARYVAHRKMVIDLFDLIVHGKTEAQTKQIRNIDERRLHNLLFMQGSDDSQKSNLWFLNEEYIYFSGLSEYKLKDVTINGKTIFKDIISEEEDKYLHSLGEDRRLKRPDILLFPAENKCIIIELKTPSTNLSLHINQIRTYAYFLRNFTNDEVILDTFYGYLIGEALEPRDVRAVDGDFKVDPRFNYCYRRNINVVDDNPTKRDGSLDIEVIQYSVLHSRAEHRNKTFIDKLFPRLEKLEVQDGEESKDDKLSSSEKDLFSEE